MNQATFDPRLRIEFEVRAPGSLDALKKMLATLQQEKQFLDEVEATGEDIAEVCGEARWRDGLSVEAQRYFDEARELSAEEWDVYNRLWELTAPSVRLKHPMFHFSDRWDFESVLDAILNGDYALLSLEVDGSRTTLFYLPPGLPFGGSEALMQLIEAFGHRVTFDQWHGGAHLRTPVGWDFERAARLVERGQGLSE